jgi:hypothetical protein
MFPAPANALEHLEIPRCPECGRLVGFKNTRPEDIGLTEEEMRDYAEKKRRSRQQAPLD